MLNCVRDFRGTLLLVLVAAALLLAVRPAWAEPSGASIPAGGGSAIIHQAGGVTTIQQQGNRLIIDWNKFGISANELVKFVQPSQLAAVLNRVTGVDPSVILGSLQANGRVFLVNPNGLFFGHSARVDVGSLMATTLNMNNEDFLKGIYRFAKDPNKPASFVVNQGSIRAADGGFVVLAAPLVSNEGVIICNLGRVTLTGTNGTAVSLDSQGLVNYVLPQAAGPAADVIIPPEILSQVVRQAVGSGGLITGGVAVPDGDRIRLVGAGGLAIQAGTIRADGPGGLVTVNGAQASVLADGSTTTARGGSGESGGRVVVTGQNVALLGNASVDVSGGAGGGTALIGGDYQGQGTIPVAQSTYVGPNATIRADATELGNGGTVIVWGNERSATYGLISARGGPGGGDGGFVETSAHHGLQVTTMPDVTAPRGHGGTWLLDPQSIIISTADFNQYWDPNVAYGAPLDGTQGPATLDKILVENALNAGISVTITTVPWIGATDNPATAGDITVLANITKVNGGDASLILQADRNITIDGTISSVSNKLNLDLTATRGAISVSSTVTTNGGDFTANSAAQYTQSGTINTGGGDFSNTGTSYTLTGNTNTGGGTFTSLGTAYNQTGNVTTGGGDMLIGTAAAPRLGAVALNGNINTGAGSVQISTDNGATTQGSGTSLLANGLRLLNVNGGDFLLTQTGNHINTLAANTASEVHYRDLGGFTVGTVTTTNGTTSGITTANRLLNLRGDGTITVAQNIDVGTNVANLRATSGNIVSNGAGTVIGNVVNLRTDAGSVGTGPGARLNTDAGTMNINDGAGGVGALNAYVNEANSVILNNLRVTNTIDVLAAGTLTVAGGPDTQLQATTISLRSTGGNIVGPGTVVADTLSTIADTGSVGSAGSPLLTSVNTLLAASANGGGQGVYISNDKNLAVTSATATGANGTVRLTTTSGGMTLANGAIVTAIDSGTVNLTAATGITDGNATSVTGSYLTASAGTGSLGTVANPLNTLVAILVSLSANTANQGVYLTNAQSLTVTSVTATGTNGVVQLATTVGVMVLGNGAIVTPATTGTVQLVAAASLFDDTATSITANSLSATSNTSSIGSAGNALNTSINTLSLASANTNGSGVYLANDKDLAVTSATSTGTGGKVYLTTIAGGLTLADGAVLTSGTTGIVQLTAATGITDGTATSVTGNTLTATAGTGSIGANGNPLNTTINTLSSAIANGNNQGVYLSNSQALSVILAQALGTDGTVQLTTTAGGLTLGNGSVATPNGTGTVVLTAATSILDGNLTSITGNTLTATANTGSIGANGNPLNTSINTLASATANGNNQAVYLTNDKDLAVTSATSTGTNGTVNLTTTAGGLTLANNAVVTPTDTGAVTLTAATSILDGAAVSITGNLLTATAVAGTIGDVGSPLDTRVHVLVGAAQGLVNMNNTGTLTINRLVSTVGSVTLVNDDRLDVTAPTVAGSGATVSGTLVALTENGTSTAGITVHGPSGTANNPTIQGTTSVTITNTSTGAGSGIGIEGVTPPATSLATVVAPTVNVNTTGVAGTPHDITLGTSAINATNANLSARGSIVDGTAVSVTAANGSFTADTGSVGQDAGNPLNTTLNTLVSATANSPNQGVYLSNTQDLVVLSATATGTNGRVELTTTSGGITLVDGAIVTPTATGTVVLNAATGITDGVATSITGNALTATAGTGSIGASGNPLGTMIHTLTSAQANTANQGVYLSNGQNLAVTSATALGTNGTVQLTTTVGGLTLADNAIQTPGASGTVQLTAATGITDGAATSVTGNTLTASAGTGSIGGNGNPLNTMIHTLTSGTANANNQGVFVSNGQDLAVTSATALGTNGTVQLTTTVGGLTLANGAVQTSGATGTVQLAGATNILDGNLTSVTGNALTATAGTGSVGTNANPLSTLIHVLTAATANTANQGVFLSNAQDLAVTSATSLGANGTVQLTTTVGGLTLGNGAVVTPGDTGTVQLLANTNITDGALTSVTANRLDATAVLGSIGAGNNALNSTVHHLTASANSDNQRINVANSGLLSLDNVSAAGAGGTVVVTNDSSMTASFVLAGNAAAPGSVTLAANAGDLTLGNVTALNGMADLSATAGNIVNGTGVTLTTGTASLYALGAVGSPGNALQTDIDTLNATAVNNGIYLTETNGITLNSVQAGADANLTALAGDMAVHNVTAGNVVRLTTTGGAILDRGSMVTAPAAVFHARTNIGTVYFPLQTNIGTLDATANSGIFLTEQAGLTVGNVTNQGSGTVQLLVKTGDMVIGEMANNGGGVNLETLTGSILDNGENTIIDVTAFGDSTLRAAGVIGTGADPLEVNVLGRLGVAAGGVSGDTSVSITGSVQPSNTLDFLNVPPGLVLFNGRRLGGFDSQALDSSRADFNPLMPLELMRSLDAQSFQNLIYPTYYTLLLGSPITERDVRVKDGNELGEVDANAAARMEAEALQQMEDTEAGNSRNFVAQAVELLMRRGWSLDEARAAAQQILTEVPGDSHDDQVARVKKLRALLDTPHPKR